MELIQATGWPARSDLGVVQLLDRQGDADTRERSTRAYRGSARNSPGIEISPQSTAPVSLELSGYDHPVEAFANFTEAMNEGVHVRLVDAVTTRTLGEITVGSTSVSRSSGDDYRHLRLQWGAYPSSR